ncbi:hypothetical protein UFOVP231_32 [uncultured Caudovirales phage]|uniref:Uncharacterized protein n=1 Tax=uncultured Caudovirales phage TaxID=2100421 RepID=A0A6J7WY79_9CAUD|nr:hypothetical protein UFOVP231_32 [uncultured Caudovirales phage]
MDQTSVTVAMTVAQWNVVMKALGELPFRESADVIMSIKTQAEMQLAPASAGTSEPSSEAA